MRSDESWDERRQSRAEFSGTVVRAMQDKFPMSYWRERDDSATFPHEFFRFAADQGWLGLVLPEEHGGSGLGIGEAATFLEAIARSGGGLSATSAIHMNVFGVNVVVKHGSDDQRRAYLPQVAKGEMKVAFGVTEPDAGLDTTSIRTTAKRSGDRWVINGRKIWISTAQVADMILLLTRTTPREECRRRSDGLTLFFTKLDRSRIEVREIPKAGRAAVDSNELFIDNLEVSEGDMVGPQGDGFRLLLDGLNPERLLVAAEAIGIGRAALEIAVDYAKNRHVFGRPIGMNQGIQFPLAECHAKLEMAWLMVERGVDLYDTGLPCGAEANMAKLYAGEWGFEAADTAMQVLGGMGYAREYHVERLWREVKLSRIAPVSPELIKAYIAEHILGLPRSY